MWRYETRLQFPVKIQTPNARLAKAIVSQLGGPDGELAASLRYLSQRYAMPTRENMALLTDIGTEELAHMEIISAIIRQLTQNLTLDQIRAQGFDAGHLAAGRQRRRLYGRLFPVQGRSDHGPERGHGRGAKGAHHL